MKKKNKILETEMTEQANIYTVKKGDTLWGISKKFAIDIDLLAQKNGLNGEAQHLLRIGQKLLLLGNDERPDTEITFRLVNLLQFRIPNVELKVHFNGTEKSFTTDEQGEVGPISVQDHAQGVKVFFKNIEGEYELIAEHAVLPLGEQRLVINSREILLKSRYWPEQGKQDLTTDQIKKYIKRVNQDIHTLPSGEKDRIIPPKATTSNMPTPVLSEVRAENGKPLHVVGAVFAEENLYLKPANEKYRKFILASAQRYEFAPSALAGLINAEAAKAKDGEWKADSLNTDTQAAGLTQFLPNTWLEMCANARSLMNARIMQENGYEKIKGEWKNEKYVLYGYKNKKRYEISPSTLLKWRFNPEYSIDTAALYGKINLEKLKKNGIDIDALTKEDLAKVMYLAHHDGAGGAESLLKGTLAQTRARYLLEKQIKSRAEDLIYRAQGDASKAYSHWLFNYIDSHINVTQFMVKPDGLRPKNMGEIALVLGHSALPSLAPKKGPDKQPPSIPAKAGGAEGWRDPLDICTLRIAKLASRTSATFGMVRNGGKRAHQGIDLVALPGTPVYAVSNGKIVIVRKAYKDTQGYGATVLMEVDVEDLPLKQKQYYQGKYPNRNVVFFFYAHLSDIVVEAGSFIEAGEQIGKTGESGNAKGMNTVQAGAHLHFEARYMKDAATGLAGRLDPLPFLNHYN